MNMLIPRNPFPHNTLEILKAFIKPKKVDIFRNELIKFLGVDDIIITRSGREALYIILKSFLKPGDELVVPAFTCNVIIGAIEKAHVVPVFADVDKHTLNMGIKEIKDKVGKKTKAVLLTHQFGFVSIEKGIKDFCRINNLLLIEDAAAALGSSGNHKNAGTFGDIAFFSMQFSKVVSTIEGGFVAGQNLHVQKIRTRFSQVRQVSSVKMFSKAVKFKLMLNPYIYHFLLSVWKLIFGSVTNADKLETESFRYKSALYSISDFQAALGLEQLWRISRIVENRNKAARKLIKVLMQKKDIISIPQNPLQFNKPFIHSYSRFSILVKNKEKMHLNLYKKGVDLGFSFSYMLPDYYGMHRQDYPNCQYIIEHILNVPIHYSPIINHKIAAVLEKVTN